MKPQTGAFLDKSRELLDQAATMLEVGLTAAAGRTAYLAGLHAAQALVFERTGRIIKRHRGVRNELWRLTKDEPRFDPLLQAFLGRAYSLKEIADYETGPGSHVSDELARSTVEMARRFVEVIAGLFA
ncbi:MAG TPA: HEPN domain-containing protein [Acidisoma sp.]|jgi:uncharacterized protein (UPF0332 family)|nr:HEPN domain-containing protein [Acidisoma sp.]